MAINKLTLEPDGLVVGANQLVTSGGGVYIGQNLAVQRSQTIGGNLIVSGNVSIGNLIVTTGNSATLTSTRVNPRSSGLTGASGVIIPASDTFDQINYSLTGSSSFSNPSGTPVNGQKLTIRLYAATTQTISSWSSTIGGYRAIGATLPTTITGTKTIYVGCVWNSADSFWDVIAVATQA